MEFIKSLEEEFKEILNYKEEKDNKQPEGNNKMDAFKKDNVLFLWIGAAILCVITWVNYQNKVNNQYVGQQDNSSTELPQSAPPWYNKNNSEPKESVDVETKVETLKVAVQKIWERTKWNTDRTLLLSIISNNNNNVVKNNYPKSELIFLNSDWTINKMPTAINLDEADKEFLKQFIKP